MSLSIPQRDYCRYQRPTLAGLDLQITTELPQALAHTGYANSRRTGTIGLDSTGLWWKAAPKVPDLQNNIFPLLFQFYVRRGAARVPFDIRQALLHDAKERRLEL